MRRQIGTRWRGTMAATLAVSVVLALPAHGQAVHYGQRVPASVRLITERGLRYLAASQRPNGMWEGRRDAGPGQVAICVMAFLASGEDPNFGPYAKNIRRSLRYIVMRQDPSFGYIGNTMYHHGFATLCLSEAYGVVHDDLLWKGTTVPKSQRRSLGKALTLAVRCSVTAQKSNAFNAWRYSPTANDADTTVSGTVFMGLLGARNAGIEIPAISLDKTISYFNMLTAKDGRVLYQSGRRNPGSMLTRSSIATLVYAITNRKNTPRYKATSQFVKRRMFDRVSEHELYSRYYVAQALFQSDVETWKKWNRKTIEKLQALQNDNGSFPSQKYGPAYGTGMSLLALAVNYRLLPIYER